MDKTFENGARYPSCTRMDPAEHELYKRLKAIYERYSDTWDEESKATWFQTMPRASITVTNTNAVRGNAIAKLLNFREATWADFVILHVMYQKRLFNSKRTMAIFVKKYPGANFESYSFHESYRMRRQRDSAAPSNESLSFASDGVLDANTIPSNNNELQIIAKPPTPRDTQEAQTPLQSSSLGYDNARSHSTPITSIEASGGILGSVASPEWTMSLMGMEKDSSQNDDELLREGNEAICTPPTASLKRSRSPDVQPAPKRRMSLSCTRIERNIEEFNDRFIQSEREIAALKQVVADQANQIAGLQMQQRTTQELLDAFFQ